MDVLRAFTHLPDTLTMNIHSSPSRACLLCEAASNYTLGAQISKEASGAFRGTGDVPRVTVRWGWCNGNREHLLSGVSALLSVCLQPRDRQEPASVLLTWNRGDGAVQVAAWAEGVQYCT